LVAERHGPIGLMRHRPGQPEAPGPLLAREFLPGARRYLLAHGTESDLFAYVYERPRYAWAETVVRPAIPAPDSEALAQALGPDWTSRRVPGMTGIVWTVRPILGSPETVISLLSRFDHI